MQKAIHLLISICVVVTLGANLFAQEPELIWSENYGGEGNQYGNNAIIATPDGGYVALGLIEHDEAPWNEILFFKVDEEGNLVEDWGATYGGEWNDWYSTVISTRDGGYAILAYTYSFGEGAADFWLIKTDENGEEEWQRTYGTEGYEGTHGWSSLIQMEDGGFVLAGHTASNIWVGSARDGFVVRTDDDGEELWRRTIGTEGNSDFFRCVLPAREDGHAILIGATSSWDADGVDCWVMEIDATVDGEGEEVFSRTYGGEGDQGGTSPILCEEGLAIASISVFEDVPYQFWLLRLDDDYEVMWSKSYGGELDDVPFGIGLAQDGGFALGGYTDSFGQGGRDGWLLLTDAWGDSVWSVTAGTELDNRFYGLLIDEAGDIVLTGWHEPEEDNWDIWITKYSAPGFTTAEGVVTDAENDDPLEGATVVTPAGRNTQTDEDGFYRLTHIWPDETILTASIPGYNDLTIEELEFDVDEILEVNFELTHPELVLTVDEINVELQQDESVERPFQISNDGNGPMEWSVERQMPGVEPYSLRQSYMASETVEDNWLTGVVYNEGRFYVSGRNDGNPQIYVLNQNGELISSFDQPGDHERGFKDLAYDGNLIWGYAGNVIYGFDLNGELNTSFDSPVRSSTCLAWDSDRERLWICSSISNITAIDIEGNVITELNDHDMRIYGLAYRSDDPDGYPIYAFCREIDTNRPLLQKFDPDNDETMFVTYLDTELGGSPCGIYIAGLYDNCCSALIAIASASADDGGDRIDVWHLNPYVDWMTLEPSEGELNPDDVNEISLTLDATVLQPGLVEGELVFDHEVAVEETRLPITMNVLGDENQLRELNVSFNAGWNMISINVIPAEEMWEREEGPDVVLMTDQLRIDGDNHNLLLMKDENGQFYAPQFGFNNIPYWNLTEGYLMKMDEAVEAVWSGDSIPVETDINLTAGWNIIAYFPTYDLDASNPDFYVLSPIIDNVEIAKDGSGNFLLPAFNFSNMPPWRETQGYQVKVDEDVVLNYPEAQEEINCLTGCTGCTGYAGLNRAVGRPRLTAPRSQLDWEPRITSQNMSVLIVAQASLPETQIRAYSDDGLLVGIGFAGRDACATGLAVWGDDPSTDEIDGLLEGESFELRMMDSDIKLLPESILSGSGLVYKTDDFTVLKVTADLSIPTEFYLSQAYPNPFNSSTLITYGLPVTSNVSLALYDLSGRLIQTLAEGNQQAGIHTTVLTADNLPSGLYFVRLDAARQVFTRKVMLIR